MVSVGHNSVVSMNIGDTFEYPILINVGGKTQIERYTVGAGDTLYISLCEPNQPFELGLIRRVYNSTNWAKNAEGDVIWKLSPEDTMHLVPGRYYYEIRIKLSNGKIAVIRPRTMFYLNA